MTVQLHRLEGFYRVAKAGGYARAARAFPYPITQPGVFQQVKRLEDELGVALLERTGRDRVRMTGAGETLYRFCAPFFEELPGVLRSVEAGRIGGTLRIDASALVMRQILPAWIRSLREARPDIDVELEEIGAPDLDRLRTGAADLVVDHIAAVPERFESRVVSIAFAYLALPAGHRLARRRRFDVAELAGEPFVGYHPALPHHRIQMHAVRARIGEPKRTLYASSVDTILAHVSAGVGFSVVPWIGEAAPDVPGVVALRQRGPGTAFEVRAVWRRADSGGPIIGAALAVAPSPRHGTPASARYD